MNDELEYGSPHGTLTLPKLLALCGVGAIMWVLAILGVVKVMEKLS